MVTILLRSCSELQEKIFPLFQNATSALRAQKSHLIRKREALRELKRNQTHDLIANVGVYNLITRVVSGQVYMKFVCPLVNE